MSSSYGSAHAAGAHGINPYTMHQGQQQHGYPLSTAVPSSRHAQQPPYYGPSLSLGTPLVEAQPHLSSSPSSHYYFGHRHFNYAAPAHTSYTAPASSLYDLEWTANSPSSRTPTTASSSSPASLSPPSSEQTAAATPASALAAASPYSRSLGSWDGAVGTLGSSTDAAAISPALYHSPLLGASDTDCEVAAARSINGQSPRHPSFYYDHSSQLQLQLQLQPQPLHAAHSCSPRLPQELQQVAPPSLDVHASRRRGRKRRCDEAIMALHPSALVAVKEEADEEDADDGSSSSRAASLVWPFADSSSAGEQDGGQFHSGAAPASSPLGDGACKAESNSEPEEEECDDDDFFSDDVEDCDENEDDVEDCDETVGRKKNGASGGGRRKRRVVKVERKVEKVQVTEDLNIEAHLSPESDGYRWRKYGRKTVKGSPYPRSYFKCTYPHCLVKKQVEAVIQDGHIVSTSSIYKGKHSHERPCVMQLTAHDQDSFRSAVISGFSKYAGVNSPNNTPRLVVTTQSTVDYLDDGYRWRKYGQKYVKGSGYPRSYYKCTDKQCPVKKQVDSLVSGMVITYEGAHTHGPCLDKASPRKRRRRTASASAPSHARCSSAAAATDHDDAPVIKLECEDSLAPDTDDLRSPDEALALEQPASIKEEPRASFGRVHCAPAVHPQQPHLQPYQYCQQHRLASSAAPEDCLPTSFISGGFDDLRGEMADFLLWEESSGQAPRYSHSLPPHHYRQHHHHQPQSHQAFHQYMPSAPAVHSYHPSPSFYTSSPLSASSSFAPDYDYSLSSF